MATLQEVTAASLDYFNGDKLAANVFATKYPLTTPEGDILELTPDDMHRRMAGEFARVESKYPNPMSADDIYELLKDFRYVIPQGSPMSGIGNDHQLQSLSNCFVVDSPYDSYGGILKTDQELVQIMKRRGGVGTDVSGLRPEGMGTSNAAKTSTGIVSFMERYSNTTREVAQNGRRGALMISVSIHHPQILDFIRAKRNRDKVTGANISIRLTDEFMKAVQTDTDYEVRFPVDSSNPVVSEQISAKEVWDEIIESAWQFAEPGLLFWDNVIRFSPADIYADQGFETISANPCVTGDTLIAVADGRNAVSISQLAADGLDVPVYSVDPQSGKTVIKMGRNPRMTKKDQAIWKVTLDDGSVLKGTYDHRILVKTEAALKYVELFKLQPGDSIVPFNTFNSNGYRQVCNTGAPLQGEGFRNRRQYRLIHEFYEGDTDAKTFAIHHRDFDSFNDSIDNLESMLHEEHRALHADRIRGDKNPYHQMTSEWKKAFASHPGEYNGRYSGFTNEDLISLGRTVYSREGRFTKRLWADAAKTAGAPIHVANDFRFGSFSNFKSSVIGNHKVVSVEHTMEQEDVYNITVDDNHNYCVITSSEDDRFVKSSGICIKNCGEIPLCAYDSCRLMVINLLSFVRKPFTDQAAFDFNAFSLVVQQAQRLMDDLIELELEQVEKIIAKIEADPEPPDVKQAELNLWREIRKKAVEGRRTGLGVTAVGDMLAAQGIRYGSDESIEFVEEVYKTLNLNAYRSSCQMAKERGAFPLFSFEAEEGHPYMERIWEADPELRELMRESGRRNIALLTTAPAGSVSILTKSVGDYFGVTSGIEQATYLNLTRRKKIMPGEDVVVDFVDQSGDEWTEFEVSHAGYKAWAEITGHSTEDVKKSPYWGATIDDVDWVSKVKMQAAAQKWVCHAISNTTNLPEDVSKEVVSQVYLTGWQSGCKGVTVYREGARTGVIVKEGVSASEVSHAPHSAVKRPEELPCEIHQVSIKGEKWTILVGMMSGLPYEVMGGLSEMIEIPRKYKHGTLIKRARKTMPSIYDLKVGENGDEFKIKDIVDAFDNPEHSTHTRLLSLGLRHGASVHYVAEQLHKGDKESDLFSFSKVLARVLKKYIDDGTKPGGSANCPDCGAEDSMRYTEGCVACLSCGSSKCS